MSNSPLVQATILSPNHSGRRDQKITKIAIHHAAGVINGRNLAGIFVPKSRRASANYSLGSDGVIVLGVDESNRAWTTSSSWCDNRAITIEVGNSTRAPQWLVSDYVLNRLIDLMTDIWCRDHDWCYGDRGYHKCSCDDDLLKYIINNKSRMTGGQKQAANAVEAWLRIKLNNPGKYGVLSCVW